MPVTFGRRHISTVMSNDYMISEKTDGVRYMFLICPEGSFIINRSYNFYKVWLLFHNIPFYFIDLSF